MPISLAQAKALKSLISSSRLETYLLASDGDLIQALDLYRWNISLSAACLEVIALAEVCLRNAMVAELRLEYGEKWYQTPYLFDDRSEQAIAIALRRRDRHNQYASVENRLVSELPFGVWCQLLNKGGYRTFEGQRVRCNYDQTLWRTSLYRAFPNSVGRRNEVLKTARVVQSLRNRIAHHEPIFNGIPIQGSGQRLSLWQAYLEVLQLLHYLSVDAFEWAEAHSRFNTISDTSPRPASGGFTPHGAVF